MALSDPELTQAVSKILLRAERVASLGELRSTWVDTGVLVQLDNSNNQIIYGRRGTGKSHLLRILGANAQRDNGSQIYLDLRYLGSSQQVLDQQRPFASRCLNLFKDFMLELHEHLLDVATDAILRTPLGSIDKVEAFGAAVTQMASRVLTRHVSEDSSQANARGLTVSAQIRKDPGIDISGDRKAEDSTKHTQSFDELFEETVVFANLRRTLEAALESCNIDRLLVLIDEWTTLPIDIQPYFAELLKRTLIPCRRMTVKIASLEYRSKFGVASGNNRLVGFEVGGDITAGVDLDDYYVYDRNPVAVVQTFEEVLYRHVRAELPDHYLRANLFTADAGKLRTALFTEPQTFKELVRASEGVVRDFISIFNRAFFTAQRSGRANIDVKSVREAARQWYETDKATNLSDAQYHVLQSIVTEVIGARRARSFLLERRFAGLGMIQSLFDYRVLHITAKGYSDRDNPGIRYNIYTLDYGTYVDLLQTQKQPELEYQFEPPLEESSSESSVVVPFDDRRSIRRIVLDPSLIGG